ncbi:hypothetical protein [Parapedobacter tibetensis]|uniref:hypothetical protein n=1 Tax=Parapedobacter tibetensis TaxID=2972951 RepID=UPI00214D4ABE|nr:hypothetical protein [Parapedobacter tibetensis]
MKTGLDKGNMFAGWAVFLITLVSVGMHAQAQTGEHFQASKVIPPSPTAASLVKFVDIEASHFTGGHGLGVPLLDESSDKVPIRISLEYNSANGIKVSDEASWVGLGWALSDGGGVITRSIRGLDDFKTGGYPSATALPPHDEHNYVESPILDPQEAHETGQYFRHVGNRTIDAEPDVFYYNFAGNTGKFFLGKQSMGDSIYVEKQNNLKIELLERVNSARWAITDPQGYKYFFGTPEIAGSYYKNSDLANFSGLEPNFTNAYDESENAWYLDSIMDPQGQTVVRFQYEPGLSLSVIQVHQKRYDRLALGGYTQEIGPMATVYNFTSASRQRIQNVYLRKITYDKGSILFSRTVRDDVEPDPFLNTNSWKPQKLSEIAQYDLNNALVRKFVFSYSYFNGSYAGANPHQFLRLKLDSIAEVGRDNSSSPPYRFSYFRPQELPSKYRRQIDEWGYYSSFAGYTIPGEVAPTLLPTVTEIKDGSPWTFQGVDRLSDSTGMFSKRGLLTSVVYPTGGRTEFDYEPHSHPVTPYQHIRKTEIAKADGSNAYSETIGHFTLSLGREVALDLTCYPIADDRIPDGQAVAYLRNGSNAIIGTFSIASPNATVYLSSGDYTIEVIYHPEYVTILSASSTSYTTVRNKAIGGLRIKSISEYAQNNALLRQKKFIYSVDGSPDGFSSAKVTFPKRHYTRGCSKYLQTEDGWLSSHALFLIRTSSSVNPLGGHAPPSHVTYSDVYVFEGGGNGDGHIHYNFHNLGPGFTFQEPELPLSFSGVNGKLKYIEYKDGSWKLLKRKDYGYRQMHGSSLKAAKFMKPNTDTSPFFIYQDGDIRYYDNLSEWWVTSEEVETDYSHGTVMAVRQKYFYGNLLHKQMTRKMVSQSNLDTISTVYKYPTDFTSAPYILMVAKNIISPAIVKEHRRNDVAYLWDKQNYQLWPDGVIAPVSEQQSRDGVNYRTLLRYHAYDSKGNVTSFSKDNDARVSFVWGYNKTLPIVQAVNADGPNLSAKADESVVELGYGNIDAFLSSVGEMQTNAQKTLWSNFNQKLRQKLPDDVTLMTFAYHPQYGRVCATDATNRPMYYEYDGLGRLYVVKDFDGSILETYKYQYKR